MAKKVELKKGTGSALVTGLRLHVKNIQFCPVFRSVKSKTSSLTVSYTENNV